MCLKELRDKVIGVAEKYADLLGRQIDKVSEDEMATIKDIEEINEGIRTLHHAVGTISKLDACCVWHDSQIAPPNP